MAPTSKVTEKHAAGRKKRFTRKQLREPDEFFAFTQRAWAFACENRKALIIGGIATVLISTAVVFWAQMAEERAATATRALTEAVETYNKLIVADEEQPTASTPAAKESPSSFQSVKERLQATKRSLTEVITEGASSKITRMAFLLRAGVHYDQGDWDKAIADYRAVLASADHPAIRRVAVEGLAYSYERAQRWDEALSEFQRLAYINREIHGHVRAEKGETDPVDHELLYHRARILAQQGNLKEAAKQFKQIIQQSESRSLATRASQQLMQIGS